MDKKAKPKKHNSYQRLKAENAKILKSNKALAKRNSDLEERQLNLIAGFFYGWKTQENIAKHKDAANQLRKSFAKTTEKVFIEEMHIEIEQFKGTEEKHFEFAIQIGMLTKEFFKYKLERAAEHEN